MKLISILLSTLTFAQSQSRIIRGYEAKPFKYPFMVSLQYDGAHDCGGTLYRQDTVITAAHCDQMDMDKFEVLVHRHNLNKTDEEEAGSRYKVLSFTRHPDYDSFQIKNDIAIVKINSHLNDFTGIRLDKEKVSYNVDTLTTVIGWGKTETKNYSEILIETKLPILDPTYCKTQYAKLGYTVDETIVFCAGFPEGTTDTCRADSGGPIFIKGESGYTLLGVVSWGKGCAEVGYPGYYTRISNYLPWIEEMSSTLVLAE